MPSSADRLPLVDEETGETQAIPFAAILQQMDKGRVHDLLTEELRDLVAAVSDVHKAGTLTLKIKVGPMKDDPEILVVTGETVLKAPKRPAHPSIFFADDNFNLTRDNPHQDPLWRHNDLDRG